MRPDVVLNFILLRCICTFDFGWSLNLAAYARCPIAATSPREISRAPCGSENAVRARYTLTQKSREIHIHMKCYLVRYETNNFTLLIALASTAKAYALPAAYSMTCSAAAGLVSDRGAVVMEDSPSTYQRYVADSPYCYVENTLRPEWIAARDNPGCFVGYICVQRSR